MKTDVLIAGTGFMATAYAQVLKSLGLSVIAVGRSTERTLAFIEATGLPAISGGIEAWLARRDALPTQAIVCTSIDMTADTVRRLLDSGVKSILVEKPGAVSAIEIADLARCSDVVGARTFIGYNRRFFESVRQVRELILQEGGVTSFNFEFTEREQDAISGKFGRLEQRHWGLANSSHVIDLAFHLGGRPDMIDVRVAGSLPWHPGGSRFVGSGMTRRGVLFSYSANWESGGRWGVEICTAASRIILRPLEKVMIQPRGKFNMIELKLDNDLDTRFKPGLYRQTIAFLNGDGLEHLVPISEQAEFARICSEICGESQRL
jgi:predicted dehydrogenase